MEKSQKFGCSALDEGVCVCVSAMWDLLLPATTGGEVPAGSHQSASSHRPTEHESGGTKDWFLMNGFTFST